MFQRLMHRVLVMLALFLGFFSVHGALAAENAVPEQAPVAQPPAGAEGRPLMLHLVIGDPNGSEMDVVATEFMNQVHLLSEGKMLVKISYGGSLGEDETFHFHKVQLDQQDMALGGVGNLVPMVKNLGVVTLPYLFKDVNEVVRGTTGKAGELLNAYAREAGLRILAWTYCGFRYLSNSKRPVAAFDDMKLLRIRVPQNIVMVETYRAFGAQPSTIPWDMTYKALEHGLVDGQCYDYAGFQAMNFQKVGQKYITELHYLYNLQPLVVSERLFNELDDAQRNVLVSAGELAQQRSLRYQNDMMSKAKEELILDGVQVTSIADESPWRERAFSIVWPRVARSVGGKARINEYLKACGKPEWQGE